ncbi:hypothetical protein H312_02908 [Anncaliia algerae PRA339]|uniref:Uncharacterized protein n=1 Tax=Anncaliia algerae PRA339 TaxID=1288291 RepID=A0A059EXQ8_9MICR|nr:hypothetical protein H312_02908 [Anncaliia algerae PRA339]
MLFLLYNIFILCLEKENINFVPVSKDGITNIVISKENKYLSLKKGKNSEEWVDDKKNATEFTTDPVLTLTPLKFNTQCLNRNFKLTDCNELEDQEFLLHLEDSQESPDTPTKDSEVKKSDNINQPKTPILPVDARSKEDENLAQKHTPNEDKDTKSSNAPKETEEEKPKQQEPKSEDIPKKDENENKNDTKSENKKTPEGPPKELNQKGELTNLAATNNGKDQNDVKEEINNQPESSKRKLEDEENTRDESERRNPKKKRKISSDNTFVKKMVKEYEARNKNI